ncbi:stage II sporulation protein R [Gracilibacillus halotolerans]|uniref:Stage II sporulation protein R n=1 Tax=Gracilibacillus halotolerans TaxID=74386 RepID=A0A841RUX8_9BACI|nr:stage II sporulation protein R [Gracilibacillus halotolerans]MBB6514268.1 stage II sporulation protein R [Gracilibacillus halotolerans]
MRKLILFLAIIILFIGFYPQKAETKTQEDVQVIPDEAIRLRILANSDGEEDQELKRKVRDAVNEEVTEWVEELTDIEKARNLIEDNIDEIEAIVGRVLEENGENINYSADYDENVTFPTKLYGNYLYPAGDYEAILITLGEGQGANWWCVVFPPLCFLDFSFGTSVEAEEEVEQPEEEPAEEEEVEYTFFFLKWFQ